MSSRRSAPERPAAAHPRPARWPWAVFGAFLGIASLGMTLVFANNGSLAEQVPFVVAFAMFGVVGALILSREARNIVGILLMWGSFTTALSFLAGELVSWLVPRGSTGPAVQVAAIVSNLGWVVGILPVVFFLPLLFPDGRVPSPRWKPLVWFITALLVVLAVATLFAEPEMSGSTERVTVANPLYIAALGAVQIPDALFGFAFLGTFLLSVSSLVVRFRGSTGIERQQIKWVAFGFAAAFILSLFGDLIEEPLVSAVVGGTGFLAFPTAIGVAILRFRLYDLDVVVRKAVLYAALAIFATLVYLAVVVGIGAWLGKNSSILTMAAAVVVAVTFQPVRGLLTRFADRVVYGRRATPYEVLSEFSDRVGTAYAEEDVLPRMVRVLGEGVGAERADVWLAVDDELRDVAAWPEGSIAERAIALEGDGSVPLIEGGDRAFPVMHAGELLGVLSVRKPPNDPVSPADEKLVADLAAQAGLVLRNVGLTAELRERLADLRAAQKRLVAAQDSERRRLERNIHDGAQQQLVALSVKARLARTLAERDPAKTVEVLTQIEAETHDALEDLRDLARGIYPPLLADKGLEAALTAQARKSPVPVEVHAEGLERLPQEIEAAVYFSALEALQNMAKYASASRATVTLRRANGSLSFSVVDDGVGFDQGVTGYGTGLQGMADRLGALDGELEVTSRPGTGTTVAGRVPVGAPGLGDDGEGSV